MDHYLDSQTVTSQAKFSKNVNIFRKFFSNAMRKQLDMKDNAQNI